MTAKIKNAINSSLLDWCLDQEWDWMLTLPAPPNAAAIQLDRNFTRWISEVEEKDGGLDFRWVKVIPTQSEEPKSEFHVLVGGTGSGESSFWSRRWPVLFGATEPVGCRAYTYRRELDSFVKRLARAELNIQIHVGPVKIRTSRTMEVDGNGFPKNGEALLVPESQTKTKLQRLREWGPSTLLLPFDEKPVGSSKVARSNIRNPGRRKLKSDP
jgi:hypothetical protein